MQDSVSKRRQNPINAFVIYFESIFKQVGIDLQKVILNINLFYF